MSNLYAGASIGVGASLSMEELDLGGSIEKLKTRVVHGLSHR